MLAEKSAVRISFSLFSILLIFGLISVTRHAARASSTATADTLKDRPNLQNPQLASNNLPATTDTPRPSRSLMPEQHTVIATQLPRSPQSDGFPVALDWQTAAPISFNADWQGLNSDPGRETEVRLLWTSETLFLRFLARYRSITVFPDSEPSGRRDKLWDRDVAEVFLQPHPSIPTHYKEFEVSPNGFWIDLDIAPGNLHNLQSGMRRRVTIDEKNKTWSAELAIPIKSLTANFDPGSVWRVNFYRVEGETEPRFYSAWGPTGTPQPNFHVPQAFGKLVFKSLPSSQH
jgi:hypothetical protein